MAAPAQPRHVNHAATTLYTIADNVHTVGAILTMAGMLIPTANVFSNNAFRSLDSLQITGIGISLGCIGSLVKSALDADGRG